MDETIILDIDKEEARRLIADRVPDGRARTVGDTVEFRTNSGILLAVLSDSTLPSGEQGAKLRYRTAIVSAPLLHARTQAQAIRRAVEEHRLGDAAFDG